MAKTNMLRPSDRFPALTVALPGHRTLRLPDALLGHFGGILLHRGSWCPYCNAQLAAFSRAQGALHEVNARVVALSVDDEATTAALVEKRRLGFPIGHSADAAAVAAAVGAYTNPDPLYLQSTGFVLAPDGTVLTAVYSSGAIGRLVPDDVLGFLAYIQSHG